MLQKRKCKSYLGYMVPTYGNRNKPFPVASLIDGENCFTGVTSDREPENYHVYKDAWEFYPMSDMTSKSEIMQMIADRDFNIVQSLKQFRYAYRNENLSTEDEYPLSLCFVSSRTRNLWEDWQARAALARKP